VWDKLTPSKLRADPQLFSCDRTFVLKLILIKAGDIALQVRYIDILDRIFRKILCYYRLRILASLGHDLPYAFEVHLPVASRVSLPS